MKRTLCLLATSLILNSVCASANPPFTTSVELLPDEVWYGGTYMSGAQQPWGRTTPGGGHTSREPLLLSSKGRYVRSLRPFNFSIKGNSLVLSSKNENLCVCTDGNTLREATLTVAKKFFPLTGKIPAQELFTQPQWNNWVELDVRGKVQKTVDDYTEELASSGFPCGVYIMDGGWLTHQGSYEFYAPDYPDPKGMCERIKSKGWKLMIWTAHFVSPDSREYLRMRHRSKAPEKDVLAYRKYQHGKLCPETDKTPGIYLWWSGNSCVWDLTDPKGYKHYAHTLIEFAKRYNIDGYKFDAGDLDPLLDLRFHDATKDNYDYVDAYIRVGAEHFPFNEYRQSFRSAMLPIMQRMPDRASTWEHLKDISAQVQCASLIGLPYFVADMIGGGNAPGFRPQDQFDEKLFLRYCALQALHPMMQFSALPWRHCSPEGVKICRDFANLHVKFAPYILELAHHAARTGEGIVRPMEYEFPNQGFSKKMDQFMLGSRYLVAPVVTPDDAVNVELPAGKWMDDCGKLYEGPQKISFREVPLSRLIYFTRL